MTISIFLFGRHEIYFVTLSMRTWRIALRFSFPPKMDDQPNHPTNLLIFLTTADKFFITSSFLTCTSRKRFHHRAHRIWWESQKTPCSLCSQWC